MEFQLIIVSSNFDQNGYLFENSANLLKVISIFEFLWVNVSNLQKFLDKSDLKFKQKQQLKCEKCIFMKVHPFPALHGLHFLSHGCVSGGINVSWVWNSPTWILGNRINLVKYRGLILCVNWPALGSLPASLDTLSHDTFFYKITTLFPRAVSWFYPFFAVSYDKSALVVCTTWIWQILFKQTKCM